MDSNTENIIKKLPESLRNTIRELPDNITDSFEEIRIKSGMPHIASREWTGDISLMTQDPSLRDVLDELVNRLLDYSTMHMKTSCQRDI
ncbi:MAG: hypothetical protein V8Q42_03995 [Anaerovoracaceae bacterium]